MGYTRRVGDLKPGEELVHHVLEELLALDGDTWARAWLRGTFCLVLAEEIADLVHKLGVEV